MSLAQRPPEAKATGHYVVDETEEGSAKQVGSYITCQLYLPSVPQNPKEPPKCAHLQRKLRLSFAAKKLVIHARSRRYVSLALTKVEANHNSLTANIFGQRA